MVTLRAQYAYIAYIPLAMDGHTRTRLTKKQTPRRYGATTYPLTTYANCWRIYSKAWPASRRKEYFCFCLLWQSVGLSLRHNRFRDSLYNIEWVRARASMLLPCRFSIWYNVLQVMDMLDIEIVLDLHQLTSEFDRDTLPQKYVFYLDWAHPGQLSVFLFVQHNEKNNYTLPQVVASIDAVHQNANKQRQQNCPAKLLCI